MTESKKNINDLPLENSHVETVYKPQVMHLLLANLEIAGHEVKNTDNVEKEYQQWLKFQKPKDWKRYRASVDLLVDAEYAILSAFEFQLGSLKNSYKDIGETYLRLYGVLNAVYLQIGAYRTIANLLNYPGRQKMETAFSELDIYKLRNMAGSHTTDYQYTNTDLLGENRITSKRTSFRIIHAHLERTGRKIVALDENNVTFTFNLLSVLTEYDKYSTEVLVDLINHMNKTIIKKREDKDCISERLEELLSGLIDYSTVNKNIPDKS
jgi:hypothetical protein